jgi:GntR family transcriptional repressor for pyruvate dehydrogenase complex
LRREILVEKYAAGERLPPERALASRLGTNRNTLREALRTLEAENLVRARQGDGTIVLDWRAVGEIGLLPLFLAENTDAFDRIDAVCTLLELRTLLVNQVLGLAANRGTEDDWDLVFDAFEGLRQDRYGVPAVIADVRLFHMITLASHNLVLIWVFNTFSKIFLELGRRFPELWHVDDEYLREMDEVIFDLRRGKGDKARARMGRLLDARSGELARQMRKADEPLKIPRERAPRFSPRKRPRSRSKR